MTLFEVDELMRYWIEHPPLYLLIGALRGIGKSAHQRPSVRELSATELGPVTNVRQLIADLGPAFMDRDVHAGLDPVVLEFTELRRRLRHRGK